MGCDCSSATSAQPLDVWTPDAGMVESDPRLVFAGALSESPAAYSALVALLTLADADASHQSLVLLEARAGTSLMGQAELHSCDGGRLGALAWRLLTLLAGPRVIMRVLRKGKCPGIAFNEEIAMHGSLLAHQADKDSAGSDPKLKALIPSSAKPVK